MSTPNGVVLWRGRSLIDGQPIVVVLTGLARNSENAKTGAMLQTWILADNGETPTENIKSGAAKSVCGNCPALGTFCYVIEHQAPRAVYDGFLRGIYPTRAQYPAWMEHTRGQSIRFGSYGDPAAVPTFVWTFLAQLTAHHTGYTHQWLTCDSALRRYCMASCETVDQAETAQWLGWRTFRNRLPGEPLSANEIACPAAEESGKRRTCATCKACRGAGTGRNVSILRHGPRSKTAQYDRYRVALALV